MSASAPPGQLLVCLFCETAVVAPLVNPQLACKHCRCSFALLSSVNDPRLEALVSAAGDYARAREIVQSMRAQRFRPRAGMSGKDAEGKPGYMSLSTSNEDLLRSKHLAACIYCRFVFEADVLFRDGHQWAGEPDGSATALCPSCCVDAVIPVWSHEMMERSWYHQMEAWHVAGWGRRVQHNDDAADPPPAVLPAPTGANAPALLNRCCDFCDAAEVHLQRCARCRLQWYCSRDCQQMDWKAHSKQCRTDTGAVMLRLEAESALPSQPLPQCLPIAGALGDIPDAVLNASLLPFLDSLSLIRLGRTSHALRHRVSSFPIVWSSADPVVVRFPQHSESQLSLGSRIRQSLLRLAPIELQWSHDADLAATKPYANPVPPSVTPAELCCVLTVPHLRVLDALGRRGISASVWNTLLRFPSLQRSLEQLRIGQMKNLDVPQLDRVSVELITGLSRLHTLVLEPTMGHDTQMGVFQELHRCPALTSLRYHQPMRWQFGQAPFPIGLQSAMQCVARCPRLRDLTILDMSNLTVQWIPFCRAPAMQQTLQRLVLLNAPHCWRMLSPGAPRNADDDDAHLAECAAALASMRSLTELHANCSELVRIRTMLPSNHRLHPEARSGSESGDHAQA